MSLLSFEDARPWAKAIKRAILDRSMPPWGADERFGRFGNDPSLTPEERAVLVRWVDAGAPRGDGAPPPAPKLAEGWNHPDGRPPDVVLEFPFAFEVPATGVLPNINIYSVLPESLIRQEHFIEAVQFVPGNPTVLHHASLSTRTLPRGLRLGRARLWPGGPIVQNVPIADRPELVERKLVGERAAAEIFSPMGTSHLVYYFPGNAGLTRFPIGAGKRIRGTDHIEWGLHYTPSGRPETDRPRAGLWLHKKPPSSEVITLRVGDFHIVNGREVVIPAGVDTTPGHASIVNVPGVCGGVPCLKPTPMLPSIPPHAENWKLTAITPFQNDVTLYAANPHGHLRLRDMAYVVTYPDGKEETILSVPSFDFSWQHFYRWEQPIRLPAGATIKVIGHYDNSRGNQANPAPDQSVQWGEQSTEEMFNGFIEVSVDRFDARAPASDAKAHQIPLAMTVGCVEEDVAGWRLVRAAEVSYSTVVHADAAEIAKALEMPLGRREFRLLGTAEFGSVSHFLSQGQRAQFSGESAANVTGVLKHGHKVAVKGLLIADKASPKLNLLSVQSLSHECR